jgi:hypothetical protein
LHISKFSDEKNKSTLESIRIFLLKEGILVLIIKPPAGPAS